MVAIARAISFGARVLILDEPTSSLTETEVYVLFDVMRRLKSQETAIVYISHRFEELYAVCDRVTVLRNGRNIVTRSLTTLNRLELVCHLLGRRPDEVSKGVTAFAGQLQNTPSQPVLLQAEALKYKQTLNGVSLKIRRGEIVGLAGLLGSGRSETARALFGAEPLEDGTVKLEGSLLSLHHPHDAIAAVVVGGTPFSGGRANVLGTVVGVLLMQVISTSFNMLLIPFTWSLVLKSVIILFAILMKLQQCLNY